MKLEGLDAPEVSQLLARPLWSKARIFLVRPGGNVLASSVTGLSIDSPPVAVELSFLCGE